MLVLAGGVGYAEVIERERRAFLVLKKEGKGGGGNARVVNEKRLDGPHHRGIGLCRSREFRHVPSSECQCRLLA